MKDRAVKLEQLEKFRRDCQRRGHVFTDVERNLYDAVQKECTRTAAVQ